MENNVVKLEKCYYRGTRYKNDGFSIVAYAYYGGDFSQFPMMELHEHQRNSKTGQILITGAGNYLPETEEAPITLVGTWQNNPKYPLSFKVQSFEIHFPETKEGIIRWLAETIKGVGKQTAEDIFAKFGKDSIKVLGTDLHDHELLSIRGITETKLEVMKESYASSNPDSEMANLLRDFPELTASKLRLAYNKFTHTTSEVVRNRPYELSKIDGIGFKTADAIALKINPASINSRERIVACIAYTLQRSEMSGHMFLEQADLINAVYNELLQNVNKRLIVNVCKEELNESIDIVEYQKQMIDDNGVPRQQRQVAIYSKEGLNVERTTADNIVRLLKSPVSIPANIEAGISTYESTNGITLHKNQRDAIKKSLTSSLSIITGGPGTGKTTIINCIRAVYQGNGNLYKTINMMAPTGRAAKRMSETTNNVATTIHSGLNLRPNSHNEVDRDTLSGIGLLIVDEMSMVDSNIGNLLLQAINEGTQVVFIGDVDQLEPVGPGAILLEMIKSERVPYTRLNHVYRSATDSLIIPNSRNINTGSTRDIRYDSSFQFIETSNASQSLSAIVQTFKENVDTFGLDEVMYLSPFRNEKQPTNVIPINHYLRDSIQRNDPNTEFKIKNNVFDIGNKVMCTKNTNFAPNGEIGYIVDHKRKSISRKEAIVSIEFGDGVKALTYEDMEHITLAYGSTIHKSQGSEWKCVIVNIETFHSIMLKRKLIYTAITRAKTKVILVGSKKAFYTAVTNAREEVRNTMLGRFIVESYENW